MKSQRFAVALTLVAVVVATPIPPGAAVQPRGNMDRCLRPVGITRTDHLLETVSRLPHYQGREAGIDIHQVSPTYPAWCPSNRKKHVAIMIHGRTIEAVTAFDLQYGDYSLMESMALAGIETFSLNFLGFGLSTRFGLDDPCNASTSDQEKLIPNPLSERCPQPDPFSFTTQTAMWGELREVLHFVRKETKARRVSLFGWSMGGPVVASYAKDHPRDVKNLVLETPAYTDHVPEDPPEDVPRPGLSLGIADRSTFEAGWAGMADSTTCPGQRETDVLDPIWNSLMARDPVGSQWGDAGILRFAHADRWGWGPKTAAKTRTPTLLLAGLRDTLVSPEQVRQTYRDIGSTKKVLVNVSCGSHFLQWEGSSSPTWHGPRATLADAAIKWITSETFEGMDNGIFTINTDGSISRANRGQ